MRFRYIRLPLAKRCCPERLADVLLYDRPGPELTRDRRPVNLELCSVQGPGTSVQRPGCTRGRCRFQFGRFAFGRGPDCTRRKLILQHTSGISGSCKITPSPMKKAGGRSCPRENSVPSLPSSTPAESSRASFQESLGNPSGQPGLQSQPTLATNSRKSPRLVEKRLLPEPTSTVGRDGTPPRIEQHVANALVPSWPSKWSRRAQTHTAHLFHKIHDVRRAW